MPTEHRNYNVPEAGEENWHVPINENWEMIDADVQAAMDAAQAALDAATSDDSGGDTDSTTSGGGTGFSWDQTHSDTSWLYDADAADNLNVEVVTSLDIDGPGSITEAIESGGSAPTLVVFEVGGVIDIGGGPYWRIEQPNTYIAGQTAPYPGITMIRGGPRIQADNVIVEHMSFLPGDDVNDRHKSRSLTYNQGSHNILVDHCTAAMAPDTNVNIRDDTLGSSFINGINSEALNNSSHPEAPHGYGFLVRAGSQDVTYAGNLMTHNWKRHIKPNENCHIAYVNNYIYNWGERVWHGSESSSEADWIGGVVEAGPDTDLTSIFSGTPGIVYWEDNTLIPSDTPLGDDNIDYVDSPMHLPSGLGGSDIVPASDLEDFLAPMVGPRPADRAPYEQRIVEEWANRSGHIIDHHNDVGGYPDYSPTSRALDPPSTGALDWLQSYTDEVEGTVS